MTVGFSRGPDTPKPAAWVVLDSPTMEGELIVWVSGEGEMAVGNKATGTVEQAHLELADDGIGAAVDELASRVLRGA